MFENIQVKQILEVLKRQTTDEKEMEAEMKGSQERNISGKSLWLAAHMMEPNTHEISVNRNEGVISLYAVNATYTALLTMQVGTESLEWESEYPYEINAKNLKESLKNYKKTTKKQIDMLKPIWKAERSALLLGREASVEFEEKSSGKLTPNEIKVDFNDGLILDLEEFKKAAKAMKFCSATPTVMYDPSKNAEEVVFSTKGVGDSITARVTCVPVDGQYDLANNTLKDRPWSVDFSAEYIKPLQRIPKNATISIAFAGSDMPIQFDFSGEEGGTPYCGRLLIAPRVEDY